MDAISIYYRKWAEYEKSQTANEIMGNNQPDLRTVTQYADWYALTLYEHIRSSARVFVNAQMDIFMSEKYSQNVENFGCDQR